MTRRLLIATVGLLALAVSPVMAVATHGEGQGSAKKDFAVGTGHFQGAGPAGPTDVTMHVNAKSGPAGQNAKGRFFVHRELPSKLDLHGTVTCLKVVGNQAVIGGRIDRSKISDPLFPEGGGIVIQVDDTDEGTTITDRMHGGPSASPPATCPDPIAAARLRVQQGNFVVHDNAG